MNRHSGLHRHSSGEEHAGDPLDGLVNLFDIGIVLAVAFLIAGLGIALRAKAHQPRQAARGQHAQTLQPLAGAPSRSGRGQAVGTVYRLPDGQLLYVKNPRR